MAYCRLCEAEAAFLIRSPVTALGCFLIRSRQAHAARRKYISCGFHWTLCVSIAAVWFAEFMSITAVRLFAHVSIDETAETRVSKRKPNTAPLDLCAVSMFLSTYM